MDERGIIRLILLDDLLDARMQATAAQKEYEIALNNKNQSAGKIDFALNRAHERLRAYRRIAAICREYGIDAEMM